MSTTNLTMDRSEHKPLYVKAHEWRNKWFFGPLEAKRDLRRKYGNDLNAYLAAFRLDDIDQMYVQERGMQTFVRMERRLLREMRLRSLLLRGRCACEAFVTGVKSDCPNRTTDLDFIFVSLDFEGSIYQWGIKEAGFTNFDTRDVLQPPATSKEPERMLHTTKYELGRHNHKYLHGSAIRTHAGQLPDIIRQHFNIQQSDADRSPRKIVLVGHGILNEIRELDEMGVFIEDFPWIEGIIDTSSMSTEVLGVSLSLGNLARMLGIDTHEGALHCAGNDSNYTMRALLALIYHQQCDGAGEMLMRRLNDIAMAPVRETEKEPDVPVEEVYEIFGDGGFDMFA